MIHSIQPSWSTISQEPYHPVKCIDEREVARTAETYCTTVSGSEYPLTKLGSEGQCLLHRRSDLLLLLPRTKRARKIWTVSQSCGGRKIDEPTNKHIRCSVNSSTLKKTWTTEPIHQTNQFCDVQIKIQRSSNAHRIDNVQNIGSHKSTRWLFVEKFFKRGAGEGGWRWNTF